MELHDSSSGGVEWTECTFPNRYVQCIPHLCSLIISQTGIGLGGSTSVNCLVYTRGSSDDIDRWAELAQDEQWGWKGMLPYFKKVSGSLLPRPL